MTDKFLPREPTEEMIAAAVDELDTAYLSQHDIALCALRAAWDAAPTPPAEVDVVEAVRAAQALVDRLEFIHADPAYMAVWTSNHIHNGPYSGPQYKNELDDLKAALTAIATPPLPEKQE
jgi:hypothetical protein